MSKTKKSPKLPYYAVIFTSTVTENKDGYEEMSFEMFDLAQKQPGFIGVESAREYIGITVSYWESLEDVKNWKKNVKHLVAQKLGKEKWYSAYRVRICLVEREYEFIN